jgi:hypothetical protein
MAASLLICRIKFCCGVSAAEGVVDVHARVFIRPSNYDNRLFLSSKFEAKIEIIQVANKQLVLMLIFQFAIQGLAANTEVFCRLREVA